MGDFIVVFATYTPKAIGFVTTYAPTPTAIKQMV